VDLQGFFILLNFFIMIIFKALCQSTKMEMEVQPSEEWGISFCIKNPEAFEDTHEILLNSDEVEALIKYLQMQYKNIVPLMFPDVNVTPKK
jgi:hypothetical protein